MIVGYSCSLGKATPMKHNNVLGEGVEGELRPQNKIILILLLFLFLPAYQFLCVESSVGMCIESLLPGVSVLQYPASEPIT